jgi:hypothetical protein
MSKELRKVKTDQKQLDLEGDIIHNINKNIFKEILSSSNIEALINQMND